jgi:hypothetical protein
VDYVTVDGSALVADGDYEARSGSVAFPAGVTTQTRGFKVFGDTNLEPDEAFTVDASAPLNLIIVDPDGLITILNND